MTRSARGLQETIGLVGVVIGLVFVGYELRQSNIHARGASYQAIGAATAELHLGASLHQNQLFAEAYYGPESIDYWSPDDWMTHLRGLWGAFRIYETLLLQIEVGVLPPEAVEQLGWGDLEAGYWDSPANVCLWPQFQVFIGPALLESLEATRPDDVFNCDDLDVAGTLAAGRGLHPGE